MRFGWISCEGTSLAFAARLVDEGEDVLMYHMPPRSFETPRFRHVGEGIVPIAPTWEAFMAWQPDIVFFDSSGQGKKADALRTNGIAVVGGGSFCDKLESDREYAFKLVQSVGIEIPPYHASSSISSSISWIEGRPKDEKWYVKTDRYLDASVTASGEGERLVARLKYLRAKYGDRIRHVLQANVPGIALSTGAYWNGKTFLRPWEGTLERKEFGNDDTGPKTGCCMNVVWFYPNETQVVQALHFDKLAEVFRREEAPPCLYDINAILPDDGSAPKFLEFTPRYGYDSEPTCQRLLQIPYGEFIAKLAEGTLPFAPFDLNNAAMAVRLSVPPYPFEVHDLPEKKSPVGLPLLGLDGLYAKNPRDHFVAYGIREVDGSYEMANPEGIVGLSSAVGVDVPAMNRSIVKYAKSLGIADLGYRTDAGEKLLEDLAAVRKAGYPAPRLEGRRSAA